MACRDIRVKEHLPEFATGSLAEDVSGRVAHHLKSCSECTLELAVFQGLASTEVPDPGEEFWARLPGQVVAEAKSLQEQPDDIKTVGPKTLSFSHRWALGGGLAAAGAAALILLFLWPFGGAVEDTNGGSLPAYTSVGGGMVSLGIETELLSEGPMEVALLERALELDDEISREDPNILEEGSLLEDLRIHDLDEDTLRILEKILDEMMPDHIERG